MHAKNKSLAALAIFFNHFFLPHPAVIKNPAICIYTCMHARVQQLVYNQWNTRLLSLTMALTLTLTLTLTLSLP